MPRTYNKLTLSERFNAKVDKESDPNGCWLWTASTQAGRYGQISLDGTSKTIVAAHRVAIFLATGVFPADKVTRHRCPSGPNVRCVNPQHLQLGSPKDNVRDAIEDGVFPMGEKHYKAKLTVADVKDIIHRAAAGESYASIARRYSVRGENVRCIANGKIWKSVPRTEEV